MPEKDRPAQAKKTADFDQRAGKDRGAGQGRRFSNKRRSKKPLADAPAVGPEVLKRIQQTIDGGTYIVFDIETTGGNPERNGITEIFALKYHLGEVKDTFYSMVNPGISIPPIVRRMTGIDNKMVRAAPRIAEVMPQLVEFIGHDVLVSHNTIGDMKFIRHFATAVCKVTLQNFYLCTHLLVEKLVAEAPDKSLKGLANFFTLARAGELHRAEADAYVTLELFKVLVTRLKQRSVQQIEEAVRLQGDLESSMRLGWGIPAASIEQVPPGPGIFYLFDHEKKCVFLSSALQLDRELAKLRTLQQLPRPLLRLVLRSYDLQIKRTANPYAALLEECDALQTWSLSFQPEGWHQRLVPVLFMAQTGSGWRLAQGPLTEDVLHAFGPVRDRRLVGDLIAKIAAAFELTPNRGDAGVLLPPEASAMVVALMAGTLNHATHALQKSLRSLKLLFNWRLRRLKADQLKIMRRLLLIDYKPRLPSLLEHTGLLLVPEQQAGVWQVHSIVAARPRAMITIKGDPFNQLRQAALGQKLLTYLENEHQRLQAVPLNAADANKANATLWWLFNGRGDSRFIDRVELAGLLQEGGKISGNL